MQAGEKRKTWDSSRFRREHMTFWPKNHPVRFPHVQTDHWTKMKTMVPVYLASFPTVLLKERDHGLHDGGLNCTTSCSSLLPPLAQKESTCTEPVPSVTQSYSVHQKTSSPQNILMYRNIYNDRARRNFCYWLVEKKRSSCKGYSFGAYKTSLGLPKV